MFNMFYSFKLKKNVKLKHVASTSFKITEVVVLKITGSRSKLPSFSRQSSNFRVTVTVTVKLS